MTIVQHDGVRVELEDIGEGRSGDYDAEDPDDVPLMRFTVLKLEKDGSWEPVDDASYCTQIPAYTSPADMERLAQLILVSVEDAVLAGKSVKKRCEELSWINPTWGTKFMRTDWVL